MGGTPDGTAALMFSDLAGARQRAGSGDEPSEDMRRAHYRILRQAATGHEPKSLGDGIIVVFDSAADAINCAIEMQRAADLYSREHDHVMQARVGLNIGSPIKDEEDFFGMPVAIARGLCGAAEGGQVLASESIFDIAPTAGDHPMTDIGYLDVAGISRPLHAFSVGWAPAAEARPAMPSPLKTQGSAIFVGREADLGRLRRLWADAVGGRRRVAFVAGEPGMGKTTLALRLAEEVHESGAAVLYGRCGADTVVPFQPFVEAIGGYVRATSERELRDEIAPIGSELSRLLPDLLDRLPRVELPPTLNPEEARYRSFDSVRRLLLAVSAARPVLLMLDDLHWSDPGSLILLQFIVKELAAARLMVVGTYRDTEVGRRHPLATSIANIRRATEVDRIVLGGLAESEVASLLERESGHKLDHTAAIVVGAVHLGTSGQPLFVREVIRHLTESQRLRFSDGTWISDVKTPQDIGVPEGVQEAIRARLDRMSPECSSTLPVAAVIGTDFTLAALQPVAGLGEERLIDVLEEAVDGQLVVERDDMPGSFRFTHALVRDSLYDGLSRTRRSELHRDIAAQLETQLGAGQPGRVRAAEIAHHLVASAAPGLESRTAHFLELAGDDALYATAYEDALRYYQQALALVGDDGEARTHLMFQVGLAQRNLGDWEPALETWRSAMDAANQLGDAEMTGRIAWGIAYQLAWSGRYQECVEIAGLGLNALGEAETADRGRLLAVLGSTFSLGGNFETGEEMTMAALDLAERLGDEELLGHALTFRAAHALAFWRFQDASELAEQAARLNRKTNDQWQLANNLGIVYYTAAMQGRFDAADAHVDELERLANLLKHHGAHLLLLRARIARAAMRGELDTIEELARREIAVCEEADFAWSDTSHVSLATAAFWRGDWDDAVAESQTAVTLEQPGFSSGLVGGSLFRELAYLGRRDEAMDVFRSLRHDISDLGTTNAAGRWVALMRAVEGFWVMNMLPEAAELLPRMEECLVLGGRFNGFDGSVLATIAGVAAAAAGEWERAERHFAAAMEIAETTPHLIEQADIRRFRAQMLLRRGDVGDRDAAVALLAEAEAKYRDLGMTRHAELAAQLALETAPH